MTAGRAASPDLPSSGLPSPGLIVAVGWITYFVVSFDFTAASVALPTLAKAFGVGTSMISWISLIYLLAIGCLLLPAGWLLDRYGYRKTLIWSLGLFTLASIGCAFVQSLPGLLVFRALQGASAAVLYLNGPALVRALVPEEHRQRAFAIVASASPVGLCTGPVLGGLIADYAGGQIVFVAVLPLVAVALMLLANQAGLDRRPETRAKRTSVTALAAMGVALGALVLALNQGHAWGWTSAPILALFALTGFALFAFAYADRRASGRLIDPTLIRIADFRNGNLLFLAVFIPMGGLMFLLPFNLQWYHGLNAQSAGLMLSIQAITTVVASIGSGWLPGGITMRLRACISLSMMALGVVLLVAVGKPEDLLVPGLGLALLGAGLGLATATGLQVVMSDLSDTQAAIGSALQSLTRLFAQMLGVVCLETVFSHFYTLPPDGPHGGSAATPIMLDAFRYAFGFAVVSLLCGLVAALRLKQPRTKPPGGS